MQQIILNYFILFLNYFLTIDAGETTYCIEANI